MFYYVNGNSKHIANQTHKFVKNIVISMTFKKRDLKRCDIVCVLELSKKIIKQIKIFMKKYGNISQTLVF